MDKIQRKIDNKLLQLEGVTLFKYEYVVTSYPSSFYRFAEINYRKIIEADEDEQALSFYLEEIEEELEEYFDLRSSDFYSAFSDIENSTSITEKREIEWIDENQLDLPL